MDFCCYIFNLIAATHVSTEQDLMNQLIMPNERHLSGSIFLNMKELTKAMKIIKINNKKIMKPPCFHYTQSWRLFINSNMDLLS